MRFFEKNISRLAFVREHALFVHFLTPESTVVDLGANRGDFSIELNERCGCKSVAAEPNPNMAQTIKHPAVDVRPLAISPTDGPVTLHLSSDSEGTGLGPVVYGNEVGAVEVPGVKLSTLLDQLNWPRIDVMKVDIEGVEIAALDSLSDERLRTIGQITIEFHDFLGITPLADIIRVRDRLARLGFFEIKTSRRSYINVLYVNRAIVPVSLLELLYIKHVVRNVAGVLRVAGRRVGIK